MSQWRHIDFYFNTKYKNDSYLKPEQQIMFERCLANIIDDARLYIQRKFYLYEPQPHCFLALELKSLKDTKFIIESIKKHTKKLNFIASAKFSLINSTDEANGEDFLIILNAFTEAYLFNRQSKLTHIVHCAMEFIHQTRARELEFYKKMLTLYGGE